jgi:hypothetical protein
MMATRWWVAASLRDFARAPGTSLRLWPALVLAACSVGHGAGQLDGQLAIDGCRRAGSYSLVPNAFFAQAAEQLLKIRVQRGGDIEVYSDGVALLVEDSSQLKREYLGTPIDVASDAEPRVSLTAYFNDTCPPGRDKTPVVLKAVSGSVRFDSIYAPKVKPHEVRIAAVLEGVRFEDELAPERRWAELSGDFDFLYVRGSPAQLFP